MSSLHRARHTAVLIALVPLLFLSSCSDFLVDAKDELAMVKKQNSDDDDIPDDPITGLAVSPTETILAVGKTLQLEAQITPSEAKNVTLLWRSVDTSIATVSATGLVTGIKEGTATIFLNTKDSGLSAMCIINIKKNVDVETVLVAGGTFNNGTANMTVSSFSIGKYEITQKQYLDVMGGMPPGDSSGPFKYGSADNYPVYGISWSDAVRFCNSLSELYGYEKAYVTQDTSYVVDITRDGFRLPTEAEWEFAARGGNQSQGYQYSGSNTIGDVAWYNGNSSSIVHAVGGKSANELGFYDMSGNVMEWCNDRYGPYPTDAQTDYTGPSSGSQYVVHGGDFVADASNCTGLYRESYDYMSGNNTVGFRIVRSADTGLPVTGVSVSPKTKTLFTGGTVSLVATLSPVRCKSTTVSWASSNTSVATVNASGVVTGINPGTATISVTTTDGGFSSDCSITVINLISGSVDMVSVPGGEVVIGSTTQIRGTVSSYAIGKYEITQKQYSDVMGSIPSAWENQYGLGDTYPAYGISWLDAAEFCNALSTKEGYGCVYTIVGTTVTIDTAKNGYRLPTEMEWQFAACGGNNTHQYTYSGSNTIDNVAWYSGNSSSTSHRIGLKASNELGLYDMSGNVYEWCNDWSGDYLLSDRNDYEGPSSGTYRIIRGGCWNSDQWSCCSRSRGMIDNSDPLTQSVHYGFRVVRRP